MERFAVVSDIHGNILALQAVSEDIAVRGISTVINLGDHVSGPLWPKETVRFLMASPWLHVQGNHERQLTTQDPKALGPSDSYAYESIDPNQREWLSRLPFSMRPEAGILAFHGTPENDDEYLLESVEGGRTHLSARKRISERLRAARAELMLCGHSHTPRCVRLDGSLVLNPGSVGLQAYRDDGEIPHDVEMGSPHARYAIIEKAAGAWEFEFVALEYDWDAAAEKAQAGNRPDWAEALRSGYLPS